MGRELPVELPLILVKRGSPALFSHHSNGKAALSRREIVPLLEEPDFAVFSALRKRPKLILFDLNRTITQDEHFIPRYYKKIEENVFTLEGLTYSDIMKLRESIRNLGSSGCIYTDYNWLIVEDASVYDHERHMVIFPSGRVLSDPEKVDYYLERRTVLPIVDRHVQYIALFARRGIGEPDFVKFAAQAARETARCTRMIYPGENDLLYEFLTEYEDVHKYIVTDNSREIAVEYISAMGLLEAFDGIWAKAEKQENYSNIMGTLMNKHGVDADEVAVVGDSYFSDILPVLTSYSEAFTVHITNGKPPYDLYGKYGYPSMIARKINGFFEYLVAHEIDKTSTIFIPQVLKEL